MAFVDKDIWRREYDMKVLLSLSIVFALVLTPALVGCGPSYVSEESSLEELQKEEEEESMEEDVVAGDEDEGEGADE